MKTLQLTEKGPEILTMIVWSKIIWDSPKKKNLFVFNNKKKSEVHAKNLSIVFSSDGSKINIVILPHIIYSL